MMDRFYRRVAQYLIREGIAPAAEEEILVYGLDMLLYTLLSFALLAAAGALVDMFVPTVLLLLAQIPLQSFGGGLHLSTHVRCFALMALFWAISMLLYTYCPGLLLLALGALGAGIIWARAPIVHRNAPMSEAKRQRMRRASRISVCALAVCMLIAYPFSHLLSAAAALALAMSGLSVWLGWYSKDTIRPGMQGEGT